METAKPFSLLANIYDEIMSDIKYEQWAEFILKMLAQQNWQGKKVLDLGCGTGNSLIPFMCKGFEVVGLDNSVDMLAIACQKLPSVKFVQANFEDFELLESFDLVISVFDSLNNLLTLEAFLQVLKQVYKHLNVGGAFVFDVNTSFGLKNIWDSGKAEGWINNIHYYWENSFDEVTKLAKIEAYCQNGQQEFVEIHYERPYEPSEIHKLLHQTNFQNIKVVSFPYGEPASNKDLRIWAMGQKL